MFYFIVSRIPIISNIEDGKFFRVFIIGTICYIILHAFLYSNYNNGSEYIQKYRSYLYYIWGADLALTGILIKIFGDNSQELEDEDEEYEVDENLNLEYKQNQKMSYDEIKRKLEEIKKYETELNQDSIQQSSPSPFIKKTEIESISNNNIEKNKNNTNENKKNPIDNTEKTQDKYIKESKEKEKKDNHPVEIHNPEAEYSDTEIPLYRSN